VAETITLCVRFNNPRGAAHIKRAFGVTDARFYWIKARALLGLSVARAAWPLACSPRDIDGGRWEMRWEMEEGRCGRCID